MQESWEKITTDGREILSGFANYPVESQLKSYELRKKHSYFPLNTGWFIGILILAYWQIPNLN